MPSVLSEKVQTHLTGVDCLVGLNCFRPPSSALEMNLWNVCLANAPCCSLCYGNNQNICKMARLPAASAKLAGSKLTPAAKLAASRSCLRLGSCCCCCFVVAEQETLRTGRCWICLLGRGTARGHLTCRELNIL